LAQGRADLAGRIVAQLSGEALADSVWLHSLYTSITARLHGRRGDWPSALAVLDEHGELLHRAGVVDHLTAPWWFEAVTVLAEAGRPAEARPYLQRGEALARRWPTPHVRGRYLLAASLLAAEPERLPLARAAVEAAGERAPALQLAARLRVGRLLLAQGDRPAAHRQLRELVADAESLGLVGLARDAETMLSAAGGTAADARPAAAPGGQLTDCERRVAELAARGLTNRQIAAELFLSTRTVEFHLTNVYRKTGVPDRHRLAGLLTAADERPAPQLRLPGVAPRLAPEESPGAPPDAARPRLSKTPHHLPDASPPRRSEARPPRLPDTLPARLPEAPPSLLPETVQPRLPDTLPPRLPDTLPPRLPEPAQPRLSAGTRPRLSEASPRWLPEP
jgi:DNA-binding CsgD family transcriptional regulator